MPTNNPASRTGTQAASNSAPYVGPRPFTQADKDIFFGRTQEAIELTSLVKAHPEVLLYAQSGAGKSSLLFAKVIPILDVEEEFDVMPVGRVRSQESSVIPDYKINNIYMFNALKDLSGDQLSVIERAQLTLAQFLKRRPRPPVASKEASDGHKTDNPDRQEKRLARVVIFDQFEEIFTLHPERYKDRLDFFSQVAEALKEDPFLRVIFSMREDYIAEVEPYIHVLPQNLRTKYRLERLRKANAFSAVKQPLESERVKETGRHFAEGAAELLVDRLMLIKVKTASGEKIEAPGEFVDPVQLQVVCQTLWEKLPANKIEITKQDIDKYANVDEALSDFYENCIRKSIAAVNDPQATAANQADDDTITEAQVRGWFEQKLITREGKRNMVFREQKTTAGLSNEVVEELENSHVIRVEMRGGEPWYELSHDRFISPIRESNRRFLLKQPLAKRKAQELEARADEWLASHRSNQLLLNRGELADAQKWMATDAAAIGYSETLFSLIRGSEAAVEHEDNKQQQQLAEAQQRRVVAEQQRSRQMKVGLVVTCLLLTATLFSTGFAWNRWTKSSRDEQEAHKARIAAETSNALAVENYNKAESALKKSRDEEQKAKDAVRELGVARDQEAQARKRAEEARAFADKQKAAAEAAGLETQRALNETKIAKAATEDALEKIKIAKAEADRLNLQLQGFADKLNESRDRAWSLKLASDADAIVLQDPEKALRLAFEALERKDTDQAKRALRRAFLKFRTRIILKGHEDIVWKALYGSDKKIVTISEDGTMRVWDSETATEQKKLQAGVAIRALAVSSDGNWLITEEYNNSGRIWNLADGTQKVLTDLSGPVAALALSPDNTMVATEATAEGGEPGATPRIWSVKSGKMLAALTGHTRAVSSITFSPNNELVATGSWDNTARIWDAKTGKERFVLNGHTDPLTSIAFDKTGQLLVTGSFDGTARVWEVATGKQKCLFQGHTGIVQVVAFSPDSKRVVTGGKPLLDRMKTVATPVPLSPDTKKRLTTADNTARLWDVTSGQPVGHFQGHTGGINSVIFSSDGRRVLTASDDSSAIIWDVTTRSAITRLQGHEAPINSAVFGPKDSSILTASDDGTAEVWTWKNVGQIRFSADQRSVITLDSTRSDSIVTGSVDGNVRFWDFNGSSKPGGTEINILSVLPSGYPTEGARLTDVAVSPKGDSVVVSSVATARSATLDNKAHVWNPTTKKFERDLDGHTDPVSKVLFSQSGRYLATMSAKSIQVWNGFQADDDF